MNKIIFCFFLVLISLINPVTADVTFNHTNTYNTYQFELDNETINLYADNEFNQITFNPDYDLKLKSFFINTSFIIDYQYYNISNQYYIYKSNIFTYDTQNIIILYIDDIESETYITNHTNYKILINPVSYEYFFEDSGLIIKYKIVEPIATVYNVYLFKKIPKNRIKTLNAITFQKSTSDTIHTSIIYQKQYVKTKKDVIGDLNPILKRLYNVISFLDSGNLILNIFTLMTYIINILLFWIPVLVISFPIILILIMVSVIPVITLFTTRTKWEFISNLYKNESDFIKTVFRLFKDILDLLTKIIQSLPFF